MAVDFALICLALAVVVALYRVLRGPTWGDRITGFDFLGVSLAALIVVLALRTGLTALLDVALIVSLLGFLGTVAFARYLLRGRVMKE
jgi:multisubunit Na+/H+ antiporter MnhF subunit